MISVSAADRHIASRLRSARLRIGMSQTDLGRALQVSTHQIQRYEAGVNSVGAGLLYCIAKALDVQMVYFFDGIDLEGAGET